MEGTTNAASIVTSTFAGFGDTLTTAAPGLLAVGLVVFGVPMVFNWAKRLVS